MSLKSLFKKKEGGTLVGNLFRAGTSLASTYFTGGVANGLVSSLNPIPTAPQRVQDAAAYALQSVQSIPSLSQASAALLATQAADKVIASGGTTKEAQDTAHAVSVAAQAPALPTLTPPVNNLTGGEIKAVIEGTIDGAKTGGVGAWLDKTKDGQAAKAAAVDATGTKIMPYALGAAVLLLIYSSTRK